MHHSERLPAEMQGMSIAEKLGATGRFPDGKIDDTDKGEIQFAIAPDEDRNLVHLNFGETPIAYVSLSPEEAIQVAQSLIKNARKVSKQPLRVEIC